MSWYNNTILYMLLYSMLYLFIILLPNISETKISFIAKENKENS